MRRDEIDKLQWRQIQWHRNAIRVETTEHGGTKSAESEADVDVDPGLLEILKTYMPKPGKGSPFVIESPVEPRPEAVQQPSLPLQSPVQGIGQVAARQRHSDRATPSMPLRKEFGSQICAQAGIFAASVALRHSSINLTREYYIDKKQPAVFQVSKLLETPVAAS